MYTVIDLHTRMIVGSYPTRKAAQRRADALDKAYGAIRYVVKSTA